LVLCLSFCFYHGGVVVAFVSCGDRFLPAGVDNSVYAQLKNERERERARERERGRGDRERGERVEREGEERERV
jgi:hypothetical protein